MSPSSGPTREPLDPVRFLSNRSSGRQGHAIAAALARSGAETTLVSGPAGLADPPGLKTVHVETACEMQAACLAALPVDVAVCAAAVSDWRVAQPAVQKLKKAPSGATPTFALTENPDILAGLSRHGTARPRLVIGFAAETMSVIDNAIEKRQRKGCDWILANDVSPATGTFGGARNTVHLVTAEGVESWPEMSKQAVAERLVAHIADALHGALHGALLGAPLGAPQGSAAPC
jgi:phosphopantothenoylcysteine decarboxylase/phosphopantothenate--cysteine ligase